MSSKYETELDLDNRNDSHTLIVELAGRDKRVLDVGTATGYVAAALAERGCEVVGIEVDPEAARQAEKHCERVVVGDVDNLDLGQALSEDSFDVIIFGDVLEHLKDPLQTLKRFRPFLRPEGYVVSSIPNIAHGSVRLALLQGKFRYQSLGLLDNTHLRFFTRESVEQLFEDAGFLIGELERTKHGVFDTEVEVDREMVAGETLALVRRDPEFQTYQFVLTAHPFGEAGTVAKLTNRVRLLLEQVAEKDTTIQALNEKTHDLERLRQRLEFLDQQLAERDRSTRDLAIELRNMEKLRSQLDNRDEQLAQREVTVHELNRKLRNMEELRRQLDDRTRELTERKKEVARLTQEVVSRNHQLTNNEKVIKRLNDRLTKPRSG